MKTPGLHCTYIISCIGVLLIVLGYLYLSSNKGLPADWLTFFRFLAIDFNCLGLPENRVS